jgi:hypothetical protein
MAANDIRMATTRRPAMTLVIAGLVAVGMLVFVTGCTSSATPLSTASTIQSSALPSTTAASTTALSTTPDIDITPNTDDTTATAPATAPSSPSQPASVAPVQGTGCPTSVLSITATREGAASGQEFTVLTFTNLGPASCTMTGYPGVSLYVKGAALGSPAVRSGAPVKTLTLAHGASVTAQLTDDTTCNAAESDTVRIYPPNQTTSVDRPITLRDCRLVIAPVAS